MAELTPRNIPHNIKISQLRAFATVAELGNFGRAALHLGISQSTVSYAIASLESELGVSLLHRGRHGAQLTPIGEQVAGQAHQIFGMLDEMVQGANQAKGLQTGHVRVAAFRSVATHILPPVIAQFQQRFPHITISITELDDHVEQALRSGSVDIGFTNLPAHTTLETWEILRDDYLLLLPPQNGWHRSCASQIGWHQLANYPLILPTAGNCAQRINHYLKAADCPLQIAYHVREDSTIISMVLQGLGAAILPRLAVEPLPPEIDTGRLPFPLERHIAIARVKEALHTPAVYAFWEMLKTCYPKTRQPAA